MVSKKHWAPSAEVTIGRVTQFGTGGWEVSCSLKPQGICPDCGTRSKTRHGWRHRGLQDFPAHGAAVTLKLRVCKWRCGSPDCRRHTFSDEIQAVAMPHARRTLRAAQIINHLGHATGGRPAERLLHRLGIGVSDDTVLRQLKRCARESAPPPRIIGIDDWSWRKATRYGTIIVDLERRAVVDILHDRIVESCTEWLRCHPEIETISRDRCGLYAQAARQGAPQALQVADRFHLVQNLRMAIEEQMNLSGRATGRALLSDEDNISTAAHLQRARLAYRTSREEIFTTIHALRDKGMSFSEIERQTGFRRRSVAKWLAFKTPPDRRRATLNPTSPWYFEEFLARRWKDGNHSGRQMFRRSSSKAIPGVTRTSSDCLQHGAALKSR